jgi:hypothetical protein
VIEALKGEMLVAAKADGQITKANSRSFGRHVAGADIPISKLSDAGISRDRWASVKDSKSLLLTKGLWHSETFWVLRHPLPKAFPSTFWDRAEVPRHRLLAAEPVKNLRLIASMPFARLSIEQQERRPSCGICHG